MHDRTSLGDSLVNLARWTSLWQALSAKGDPAPWFRTLYDGYSEPHRAYHNLQHLGECLTELDSVAAQSHNPAALEAALWFHDAVYDPKLSNNEEISAEWASRCLGEADVAPPFVKQVCSLILVTKTHLPDDTPDADLMCDIDLAILGQNEARFAEYEAGIRQEYIHAPIQMYAQKRAEILERFLQRQRLYNTESFYNRYETKARRNLTASIKNLSSKLCE